MFSSLCGFLNVKSISVTWSIKPSILTCSLQQCEVIYRFVLLTSSCTPSVLGLCKFIFGQMLNHGSLQSGQ